jgi:ribosome recycling factor
MIVIQPWDKTTFGRYRKRQSWLLILELLQKTTAIVIRLPFQPLTRKHGKTLLKISKKSRKKLELLFVMFGAMLTNWLKKIKKIAKSAKTRKRKQLKELQDLTDDG